MRKILIFVAVMFLFAGLFADKKEIMNSKEYKKMINILDQYGEEYEIFFEEDVTYKESVKEDKVVTDVDSLAGEIEALLDITGILMYECSWGVTPYYTYACMATVVGSSYNGVKHTLTWTSTGVTYTTVYTTKPVLGKGGELPFAGEFWEGCGQLWKWVEVYIPGVGGLPGHYVDVKYPFGNVLCDDVYYN